MRKVRSGLLITLVSCSLLFNNPGRANAQAAAARPMTSPVERNWSRSPYLNGSKFNKEFIDFLEKAGFIDILEKGIDDTKTDFNYIADIAKKRSDSVKKIFSLAIRRIGKSDQESSQENLKKEDASDNNLQNFSTDSKNAPEDVIPEASKEHKFHGTPIHIIDVKIENPNGIENKVVSRNITNVSVTSVVVGGGTVGGGAIYCNITVKCEIPDHTGNDLTKDSVCGHGSDHRRKHNTSQACEAVTGINTKDSSRSNIR